MSPHKIKIESIQGNDPAGDATTDAPSPKHQLSQAKLKKITKGFSTIRHNIEAQQELEEATKIDIGVIVAELENEARKGNFANTYQVSRYLDRLARISEEIFDMTVLILAPITEHLPEIKLIARKINKKDNPKQGFSS